MTTEWLIVAPLKLRTALHVGGGAANAVVDASLRRDAAGRLIIPGSALVGPLRALATRLAPRLFAGSRVCKTITDESGSGSCACPVCQLFGEVKLESDVESAGRASALWCADAPVSGTTSLRDGVGIERSGRAAARQDALKYNVEVLRAGTQLELKLTLQSVGSVEDDQKNRQLLAVLLHEWQQGRGTLGGRVGRGLGAFTLDTPVWHERDLRDASQLMAFLRRSDDNLLAGAVVVPDEQATLVQALTQTTPQPAPTGSRLYCWEAYTLAQSWVTLDLRLQFEGPMLISDELSSRWSGFDHAPLGARPGGEALWILPGSGLRGVLRAQAERIARTLATRAAQDKADFLARCPAGDPTNIRDQDRPLATSDALLSAQERSRPARTTPARHDLADRLFGGVRLGSRLIVEDAPLVGMAQLKALDLLAIDRFTGGGRDSAKFDALVLWQPLFHVRMRLENPQPWELGWLMLTLRDLHAGFTTVGFGRSKGFGQAKIAQWKLQLAYLEQSDLDNLEIPLPAGHESRRDGAWQLLQADQDGVAPWLPLAQKWVDAFTQTVADFRRDATDVGVPLLQDDSYFGVVDAIYPRLVAIPFK
ncbi:MAG: hypothetical protein EI684_08430 [Candidatus Viridilinea halotolerans]|uniref:CRISPR type III-associated protein domain-containing protein n=1 Tax=Candidatus Viridilinea halotolerans TaxID=2491704 RepID=A0A426U297_9CHLR|nr:MAG: hypothetical protein EI684_08430 [Candidatus Viridilinea halotolerans]